MNKLSTTSQPFSTKSAISQPKNGHGVSSGGPLSERRQEDGNQDLDNSSVDSINMFQIFRDHQKKVNELMAKYSAI